MSGTLSGSCAIRKIILIIFFVNALLVSGRLSAQPVISSVTPNRTLPTTSVTIAGTNFGATTAENIVYFGATKGTITSATSTSITATVDTGASSQPISVLNTTTHLVGYEDSAFIPTFTHSYFTPGGMNFKPEVELSTGSGPYVAAIGDIDGDGKPDLIANNSGSNSIFVYRNISTPGSLSAASFTAGTSYAVAGHAINVKLADIDGDGLLDVVITNINVSKISVFKNTSTPGSISFAPRVDYYVSIFFSGAFAGGGPAVLAISDFDGDGRPDLAITMTSPTAPFANTVAVLRNMGTYGVIDATTFATTPLTFPTGGVPEGIAIADINRDGKPDIITADTLSYQVTVLINTSTSGSISFADSVNLTTGAEPIDVQAGDIDGDGWPDIVVSNNSAATISVFRNNHSSTTISPSSFDTRVDFATALYPTALALGDLDGDGKIDVAVTNPSTFGTLFNVVTVFRNSATSGSITSTSLTASGTFQTGLYPFGLNIGDLDGDGYPDMVAGNYIGGTISILRNYPLPYIAPIVGDTALCYTDASTSFTNTVSGGTWSLSNNTIASITTGGAVTAHSPGVDTVFYRVIAGGDTNIAYRLINIDTIVSVSPIAGLSAVCVGSNITLSDTASGGVWSTGGSPFVASLSPSGVVHGIGAGTFPVTYTKTGNCNSAVVYASITVSSPPVAGTISGAGTVCVGGSVTLTESATLGTWSCTNTKATITSGGVVTGVAAGNDTVKYSVTNACGSVFASLPIVVNPLADAGTITGAGGVCVGFSTTLSDTTAGGTWTAVNTNASVTAGGVVTGSTVGSDTIKYTVNNSCGTATAVHPMGIISNGAGLPITGPTNICLGSPDTLLNAAGGGTWTSSNPAIATIDATTGVVTTHAVGTDTITYSVTYSCGVVLSTAVFTVSVAPVAGTITGGGSVCSGSSLTLSDAAGSGTWSSLNTSVASITAGGIVTGGTPDTVTILYTVTNGCGTAHTATLITVNPVPHAGVITGVTSLCQGSATTTLHDTATGGTWSSANTAIATVTSAGVVHGTPAGTGSDTIRYSVTNGCGTKDTFIIINISPLPSSATISGSSSVCVGDAIGLTPSASGGVWSSFNTSVATVSSSGFVVGVSAGVDTIFYSLSIACGSDSARKVITVNPLADTGIITGAPGVCIGASQTLADTVTGGVWSSADNSIATITSSGVYTGVAGGTTQISYTTTNGCGDQSAVVTVSVASFPDADTIHGPANICVGSGAAFTDTAAGGVWSEVGGYATVSSSGFVTGVSAGIDTIKYTITNGCGSTAAVIPVAINSAPAIGAITGLDSVCAGSSITLSDTSSGGTWSVVTAPLATITSSGVLTGVAAGNAIIHYTVAGATCTSVAADTILVKALPALNTTLTPSPVCDSMLFVYIPGSATTGATFTWTRPAVASINNIAGSGSDSVHEWLDNNATAPATVVYNYTTSAGGCSNIQNVTVTVNPTPVLSGRLLDTVCSGATYHYPAVSATTGTTFTWIRHLVSGITPDSSSGPGDIAEVLNNTTLGQLNVVYIYTLSAAGCTHVQDVTVKVVPAAAVPQITTMPSPVLCDNVLYQNFGAATPPPAGEEYIWTTAGGATVWATGADKQYCLVNYTGGGIAWVYLTAAVGGYACNSADSFAVYVSANQAEMPSVIRFNDNFVCEQNDMDTYQWGYDNISTLDSTILTGETNQSYYNTNPDLLNNYYWVITTHHDCRQKAYYNAPAAIRNVNSTTEGMKVAPNPSNGSFGVVVPSRSHASAVLTITNSIGQVVKQVTLTTNKEVQLHLDVPSGIYYLTASTGNERYSSKIVIAK